MDKSRPAEDNATRCACDTSPSGPLKIERISSGEYGSLSSDEVLALYDAAGVRPSNEVHPSKRQLKREKGERK